MNLKEVAEQTLVWILETVQKWLDAAPQYVVDLVHRYWMYRGISHWMWLLVSLIAFVFLVYRWIKWCKEYEERWWLLLILALIDLVPIILCANAMIKWLFVPELVLIDQFTPWSCGMCK